MLILPRLTLVPTSRFAGSLDFQPFFSQSNCQNTDLNLQNAEFGGPLKKLEDTKMNLPRETTNFYVQEYRDITLNTKL